MYFDNKNIDKMDPRLRAKLKIPVYKKSISEVDALKEKVKKMEIELEEANKSKNIKPKKIQKVEKNNIEKLNLEINNVKNEVEQIKLQLKEIKLQVNEIVDIIQSIMTMNK